MKPSDPREQDILCAIATPPTDEDWERLEAVQGLTNLIAKYGAPRVMTWVRNLAYINGEDV